MSLQLDRYLAERASGASIADACLCSGIGVREAELTEEAIAKGEVEMPSRARVHVHEEPTEEPKMAHGDIAADELRLLIERIDRLDEERKGLAEDIADVFKEAKARGFDTWAMKEIRKWRRFEIHTQQERAALLELYAKALGVTVADPELLRAA